MIVLGFDTSGPYTAAALVGPEGLQAEAYSDAPRGQAERLFPMIEAVLAEAGVGFGDLAGIGVGVGPGNFTGIRISVAAARGLALSLGCPAVGVSAHQALVGAAPGPHLARVAAPRETVYAQILGDGPETAPEHLARDAVDAGWMRAGLQVVGADAEAIAARIGAVARKAPPSPAPEIARLAALRLRPGTPVPAPKPLYLRRADAAPPKDPAPRILTG